MAEQFKPGPHDFVVNCFDKATGRSSDVGRAWKKEDGMISIKLNAFVVLDTTSKDLSLSLFPPGWKSKKAKGSTTTPMQAPERDEPF